MLESNSTPTKPQPMSVEMNEKVKRVWGRWLHSKLNHRSLPLDEAMKDLQISTTQVSSKVDVVSHIEVML